MEYIDRLKEYVEEDLVYQDYCLADVGKPKGYNDFEKYSIQHCQDIKRVLNNYKRLEEERNAVEKAIIYIDILTKVIKEQGIDGDKDDYILQRLDGVKEILLEVE